MDSGCGPSPYVGPVVDLVDPYATKDEAAAAAERIMSWMDANPGRWVMFAEGPYGIDRKNIARRYEVVHRGTMRGVKRAYARLPHPEGESINDALARRQGVVVELEDLPELAKDQFEWTAEELQKACEAARESLFPVRASRSGRGGRK